MRIFGEKVEGKQYVHRPAVYGVMFNEKKEIGIIECGGKYFLPGGGLEGQETHEECLKRENIEEIGLESEIGAFIGRAQRYFVSTLDHIYYLSDGYFYFCEPGARSYDPLEDDHTLVWMGPTEAINCLFHEHQSWAVQEAVKLLSTPVKG
ncbi:DNA mismatch repair protein MutT [Bacillus sp. FJAT-27225]|uniref:NUDIX hydrolase n=1 Tax=Bacillus sp. FJAT-27225 TaxID=1743144 RepID=UPI00080C2D9A|nr:NUDIX domain-containing protein [Bacillus sp. FJAT-27225]OCA81613.1 DNA mismatch repair protein MutT [Bacillus sp. FJAT-27225]